MTTDTTDTSHTDTDDATVDNSGVLLGGEEGQTDSSVEGRDTGGDETTFTVPSEFEGNPRFEGIDSQEALFSAIATQGAPESYTFGEGMTDDQAAIITEQAKALDMSQSQVDKMLEIEAQDAKSADAAMWTEINEGVDGLKEEWGEEFDTKVEDANKAIKAFDTDGAMSKLLQENPRIGSNPAMIKLFNAIHDQIDTDKFIDSEGTPRTVPKDEHGNTYFASYDKTMR